MLSMLRDFRFAARTFRKRPGSALVIVLTLALGIGINAAFFSAFYAMTARPLPFEDPNQLVDLFHARPSSGQTWIQLGSATYFALERDLERGAASETLVDLGAYVARTVNLRGQDLPERVSGVEITPSLFPMLGVAPAQGRGFTQADGRPGAPGVALLSHDLWQRSFGGDPDLLGRQIELDGELREVVGIMAEGFAFPLWHELWLPMRLDRAAAEPGPGGLQAIARVRSDLDPTRDLEAVDAALEAVLAGLADHFPDAYEDLAMHPRPLRRSWMPPATQVAGVVMQVLVSLVLLIVCANVANMVLAQASTRRQETALRTALGASRWRLVRQGLAESLLLSLVGAVLGLVLAAWQDAWIERLSAVPVPYWLKMGVDLRIAGFAMAVAVVVAVAIGLLPALRSTALDPNQALGAGGRSDGGIAGGDRRSSTALVILEYALAVVILVGALLMLRSYQQLRHGDLGFAADDRLTLAVSLGPDSLGSGPFEVDERLAYLDRAEQHLSSLPEVRSVAVTSFAPVGQTQYRMSELEVSGRAFEDSRAPKATIQAVSTGYFETLAIPRVVGRLFDRTDLERARSGEAAVVVIGASLAEALWPGEEAIGRQLRRVAPPSLGGPEGEEKGNATRDSWWTVVGVVGSVDPGKPLAGVDGRPPHQVYVPLGLSAEALLTDEPLLIVDSAAEPAYLGPHLRRELTTLDPRVPIFDVLTLAERIRQYYFAQHIWSRMFAVIALVALSIAAVGAYGVSSYAVTRRRREMGIRMALGALPAQLKRTIIGQNVGVAAIGLGLGLLLSWPMARAMSVLLHGVGFADPWVLGGVLGLLASVALVASYGPAQNAASVDPVRVLREE